MAKQSTALAARIETLPAVPASNPLDMLARAIEKGVDTDTLKQLMELKERHEASEARKAYVAAMAAFKAEPLKVSKRKHVSYTNKSGGKTEYDHATLAQVVGAVVGALSKHGLSHRWETTQAEKQITVSCVITHALGHSERTTLSAGPDESCGKNSIQAVGSTVSYLQRYTLMSATGLAAQGMDDDGRGADPVETLNEDQIANIDALIEEVKANRAAFLKWASVESVAQIPAANYTNCVKMLEAKRRKPAEA